MEGGQCDKQGLHRRRILLYPPTYRMYNRYCWCRNGSTTRMQPEMIHSDNIEQHVAVHNDNWWRMWRRLGYRFCPWKYRSDEVVTAVCGIVQDEV